MGVEIQRAAAITVARIAVRKRVIIIVITLLSLDNGPNNITSHCHIGTKLGRRAYNTEDLIASVPDEKPIGGQFGLQPVHPEVNFTGVFDTIGVSSVMFLF